MQVTRPAVNCLVTQCRRASNGFAYGPPDFYDATNKYNWTMKSNMDYENQTGWTTKEDERIEQLFGVDHVAWVHPVKDTNNEGKVDPERRVLWEQALYSQCPDLRNDYLHRWSQGVPQKVGAGEDIWKRFSNDYVNWYAGMYPNRNEQNPGQFWKDLCSQNLHSHVVWEQEKAKELERYGGSFGLPTDDYQTHNGVMPFLSANAFRKYKYKVHEPLVRLLNKETDGGKGTISDIVRNAPDALRQLAIDHQALTLFAKSMHPRGGALRDEFRDVLVAEFGSKQALVDQMVDASKCFESIDGIVWLAVAHGATDKLVVTSTTGCDHPSYHSSTPIAAFVVRKDIWSVDYDNVEEYAQRFMTVFDWDYAYAAYCDVLKLPRPEPLVF